MLTEKEILQFIRDDITINADTLITTVAIATTTT